MKKILIVDDQAAVRELLTETLNEGDYQIFGCNSAEQAIAYATEERPDLILMDIMMPGGMDGLEATRIIKSNPQTKDCIVMFLTAKTQPSDIEEAYHAGGNYYFTKPFSLLELVNKIEQVLN